MSNSLPSDEVAADFRDALQDLRINSRPEISNLTVIAKENTEHAQAISRELEEHIRKVGTPRLLTVEAQMRRFSTIRQEDLN